MKKSLYLECKSGISGDMTVAALLDLGVSKELLSSVLDTIDADGFEIVYSRVKKAGLDCMDFDVKLDKEHDGHDHDMDYLYGHLHEHSHGDSNHVGHVHHSNDAHENENHGHEMAHHHHHEEGLSHSHGENHHHTHRGMKEINEILDRVSMTENARAIADKIFDILAEAESKAHGVPKDQVHFHEVGAIDSIVDVVAAAVCIDDLGIEDVIVTELCEGKGTVRCQHGILPIPVPAVVNIVSANNIALEVLDIKGELVTPTGAAIVAAVKTKDALPKKFTIEKIGMGAGKRETGLPGFVRAMIINEE